MNYLAYVQTVNDNSRIHRGDKTGEILSRSSKLLKEGNTLQTWRIAASLRWRLGQTIMMLVWRYLHIWIKATNTSIPRTQVFRKRWVKHLDLVKTILYGQKIVWQCYYLPWLFIVEYCQIVSCPPVNDSLCTCQQVKISLVHPSRQELQ